MEVAKQVNSKELSQFQLSPTAHSFAPSYDIPLVFGPAFTWDSLITIRQRDSCYGLFTLFQRPIDVAIKEKTFWSRCGGCY
jgi:hypothetical protein